MIVQKYHSKAELLSFFNPDKQMQYCGGELRERCTVGNAPRVKNVIEAYGKETIESWLIIQLFDLSEYFGVKEKMTKKSLEQLASILANEYRGYRLTEFMLVFYDLKKGKYGKMYGVVDPVVIAQAFEQYDEERQEILHGYYQRLQREEDERRINDPNNITYEEYLRLKNESSNDNLSN